MENPPMFFPTKIGRNDPPPPMCNAETLFFLSDFRFTTSTVQQQHSSSTDRKSGSDISHIPVLERGVWVVVVVVVGGQHRANKPASDTARPQVRSRCRWGGWLHYIIDHT